MNPITKKTIIAVVVLGLTAGGIYTFMMYQKGMKRVAAMNADVMPPFEELKAGARAPTSSYLGLEVGKTSLDEANKKTKSFNLVCNNTSMRALMQQGRDAKKKEIEEVRKAGGDVDAVSGASMVDYRSKKERNPQVRMSCDVNAKDLGDRPRTDDVKGRYLYVHDSLNHPTRHVSFRRLHKNHPAAWDDLKASVAAMTKAFGPPNKKTSEFPNENEDGSIKFARFKKYIWTWEWTDLKAEVSATNIGRGVDVNESVEVPWPTRSDAPALGPDAHKNPPPRIQPPNPLTPDLKVLLDEMDARKKAKKAEMAKEKAKEKKAAPTNPLKKKLDRAASSKKGEDYKAVGKAMTDSSKAAGKEARKERIKNVLQKKLDAEKAKREGAPQ